MDKVMDFAIPRILLAFVEPKRLYLIVYCPYSMDESGVFLDKRNIDLAVVLINDGKDFNEWCKTFPGNVLKYCSLENALAEVVSKLTSESNYTEMLYELLSNRDSNSEIGQPKPIDASDSQETTRQQPDSTSGDPPLPQGWVSRETFEPGTPVN